MQKRQFQVYNFEVLESATSQFDFTSTYILKNSSLNSSLVIYPISPETKSQ